MNNPVLKHWECFCFFFIHSLLFKFYCSLAGSEFNPLALKNEVTERK